MMSILYIFLSLFSILVGNINGWCRLTDRSADLTGPDRLVVRVGM